MRKKGKEQAVVERIAAEELSYLQHLLAQARQTELEKQNYGNYLGVRYKLTLEDNVDLVTGIITRANGHGG